MQANGQWLWCRYASEPQHSGQIFAIRIGFRDGLIPQIDAVVTVKEIRQLLIAHIFSEQANGSSAGFFTDRYSFTCTETAAIPFQMAWRCSERG